MSLVVKIKLQIKFAFLFDIKKKGRKKVEWYQEGLAKLDKKILNSFLNAYEILHLGMGYDGDLSVDIANVGLKEAERIINWVEKKLEVISN